MQTVVAGLEPRLSSNRKEMQIRSYSDSASYYNEARHGCLLPYALNAVLLMTVQCASDNLSSVGSGYHHMPSTVPKSPCLPLQSRGHVDCGVVDVGTPCQRVEFNVVVLDLSAGVGGVHQVEALDVVGGKTKSNSLPVPDNLGAVMDDVQRDQGRNRWCMDNVVQVKLLAGECDGTELGERSAIGGDYRLCATYRLVLERQDRIGCLIVTISDDGLAGSIGS